MIIIKLTAMIILRNDLIDESNNNLNTNQKKKGKKCNHHYKNYYKFSIKTIMIAIKKTLHTSEA